ncbi:methyltransferase [Kitasatospora herbaricolor]|nr:class I SAM-dependent methyltransferase [Kitasatospora herbaricolor]MDQ0310364.1 SAM-dependent methyltransferase [Kitasatospora herbaricolor]GGV43547.1 methyltransferase [Kitasatospora herbaricolor]
MTTGQLSDPTPAGASSDALLCGSRPAGPSLPASAPAPGVPAAAPSAPAGGTAAGTADELRRRGVRALQAVAFDSIGTGYNEAFPAKGGQLACGEWLLDELETGAEVLDVGCGTGEPTAGRLLAGGLRVTGIDLSDGMLALARRTVPEAVHHRIDMYDLATERAATAWDLPGLGPAAAGRFAAATAFFSLILLPQDEVPTVLRRIRRLLRPGGLLALGMVEADLDHAALPFLGTTLRITGYLREDLERVLTGAGFAVEEQFGMPYAPASTSLPPEEQLFLRCRRVG